MNPTPAALAAIRAHVADWTPDDATIAADLNAPAVASPVPRGQVPRSFGYADVMALLSTASLGNLQGVASLPRIVDDIVARNRPGVVAWADLLLAGRAIARDERDAIAALMAATDPDPAWAAQIGWAPANLGRPADPADVAAARP